MITRTLLTAAMLAGAVALAACGDSSTPAPSGGGTSNTNTDAAKKAAEEIKKEGDKAAADINKASDLTEAATARAQALLDDAGKYIKENKLDLAEKAVGELETLKPKMTPEWQGRVDQIRSALDTAKKTGMLQNSGGGIPKIGG